MAMKVKKTEQQHVDEGEYKAVVSDIQEKEGKWGNYYIWTFMVKGATDDGEELGGKTKVTGLTSEVFSEGSKLCKWARAAGIDVDEDEIDLDEAKKAIVKVYIEDEESKKDGRIFSRISKVKSFKKGSKEDDDDNDDEEEKPKKQKKKKKTKPVEADPDDADDEEEKPKKKKKKKKEPEPEPEDDDEDDEEEKPKKKKKKKKEPVEDDDEEEEKPKKKKKKKEPEPEEDEENASDDEDDEDEELFDFDDDDD